MRVRAQRSAQGDLTRLDYVRCDKVRKVSYSELGLLVISVACQVVRCYDIGERSTNIEHCFVIPMRGHSLPLHAIQREQPSKGSSWLQTTVLQGFRPMPSLRTSPHTTPMHGESVHCQWQCEGRAQSAWSMVLRRSSVACAQVAPSRTVSISKGRVARPRATDHQLIDVGQGACALPRQIRWQ